MLTEKFKKATLSVTSESGMQARESLRGLMYRAGASDFEFSQQDSWVGNVSSRVVFSPQSEVGTVNVRRRADGTYRLILNTPVIAEGLSADAFRKMELAVTAAMDYVYNHLVGGRTQR